MIIFFTTWFDATTSNNSLRTGPNKNGFFFSKKQSRHIRGVCDSRRQSYWIARNYVVLHWPSDVVCYFFFLQFITILLLRLLIYCYKNGISHLTSVIVEKLWSMQKHRISTRRRRDMCKQIPVHVYLVCYNPPYAIA